MQLVDYYSRDLDVADYGISHAAFDVLSKTWGPEFFSIFLGGNTFLIPKEEKEDGPFWLGAMLELNEQLF